MICDRCTRQIEPHETQADVFRWNLISEAGEAFVAMTICRDCAEEISTAVPKEKKPKEKKSMVEKILKGKKRG